MKTVIYRVTLKLDTFSKPITIFAEEVDLMNLPLVIIKKIRRGIKSTLLAIPDDETYSKFKDTKTIIVPYTNLIMAEELDNESQEVISLLKVSNPDSKLDFKETI